MTRKNPTTQTLIISTLAAACFMFMTSTTVLAENMQNDMMGHMDGDQHEMMGQHETMGQHGVYGEPGDSQKVDRTITITATEIAFDLKDIKVKKGETIRFVLINKGEQPHELSIGDAAEQAEHRQMMIDMAGMSMAEMHHGEGNTISVEPGETNDLIWKFTKAGTFEFACNYPGHADLGMQGTITVK